MDKNELLKEIKIESSRSSGPGGQHVNKVETKICIDFLVTESQALTEAEKVKVVKKLKLTVDQAKIQVQCQETRSQLKNKEIAIKKLFALLDNALKTDKVRLKTTPSASQKEERLLTKKHEAEIKKSRAKIDF